MAFTPAQKIAMSKHLLKLLSAVCSKRGVLATIEPRLIVEVVEHYAKDLKRIKEHQRNTIAFHTRIGFLVFWIGKLKPVVTANKDKRTICDINEQAAVWVALVMFSCIPRSAYVPPEVSSVNLEPSLQVAAMRGTFGFYIKKNYQTLVYGIRHRNLTGDALSMLFGAVYNSFLYKFS